MEHYEIFSKEVLIGGSHNRISFTTSDLQKLIEDAVYFALKRIESDKNAETNGTGLKPRSKSK